MGRHRTDDDETTLLPATVEELAASERVGTSGSRRRALIAIVVAALLVSGVIGWAITASGDPIVAPAVSASPFDEQFSDGFGAGKPSPPPAFDPTPLASPTSTGPSLRATAASPSPQPKSSPAANAGPVLIFSYQLVELNEKWTISAVLKNIGSNKADWTVALVLPNRVTVDKTWGGEFHLGNRITITPSSFSGPLKPGQQVEFGLSGEKPEKISADPLSCTLNGTTCAKLTP